MDHRAVVHRGVRTLVILSCVLKVGVVAWSCCPLGPSAACMVSGCIGGSAFGSWPRRELKTNYRLVEIVCQLQQYLLRYRVARLAWLCCVDGGLRVRSVSGLVGAGAAESILCSTAKR